MVYKIKNNSTNYEYHFRTISNVSNPVNQGVIDIPFIGTSPGNTVLFRFMGKTEEISFEFPIYDDGTDRANGTYTSTVTTIDEQIDYLKNQIFDPSFDTDFTLTLDRYAPSGVTGVITSMEFPGPPGSNKIVIGRITFKRGNIGSW